ncbi:MAG: anhydro-N-acetylmuramic acid kinase [Gilvibacter sp.]
MQKSTYYVVGVMSGTSLDGIDLAYVKLHCTSGDWSYRFMAVETVAYTKEWESRLSQSVHASSQELEQLDLDYTAHLAQVINEFVTKNKIQNLDAICSHGHTVLHEPDKGITLQIGNNSALAQLTKQRVVCDFRVADVALGGQGAPLVPIGDRLLFDEFDYCINLGGFANLSSEAPQGRIAYDLCPVNVLLNRYAQKLGRPYDDQGKLARKGEVLLQLLSNLNALPYYSEKPPKSLGMEWVNSEVLPLIESQGRSPEDILRTLIAHMAKQIARPLLKDAKVLITGGGAFNSYLLERIAFNKTAHYHVPTNDLVNYKEALIFALLGVLKLRNEPNCLSSVTGAKYDHSSGNIFTAE